MFSAIASQEVSFWSVHQHVQPFLDLVEAWPLVGSPAWCALPDGPVKLAALLDAARHWALRVETAQAALAEASRDISAGTDWSAVGREVHQRNSFHAANPWAKRVAS